MELSSSAAYVGWRHSAVLIAGILPIFFGLLFLTFAMLSTMQPAFHIGFNSNWPAMIASAVCLTLVIGSAFAFAQFSFGYFVGFYMLMMMAGYFWLNTFSMLKYDHKTALISAATSIVMFLLPALMMRKPLPRFEIPRRIFVLLPYAIMVFAVGILLVSALTGGFHFVGIDKTNGLRDELASGHSRLVEYAIGNINGALIPFAFACLLARRRWLMLALLCLISMSFYPVTLTKTALFIAPSLVFMAVLASWFEARASVILSLFIPLAAGLAALAAGQSNLFLLLDFRMIATPSISFEHYNEYFSSHELTGFCQITFVRHFVQCPYSSPIWVVLSSHYHLGTMNASLFATEGLASIGPLFAPVSALACGIVFGIASKISATLPPRFILVSGAIVPHVLLDVPLSVTTLTNGLGLLMLLWLVTPRKV